MRRVREAPQRYTLLFGDEATFYRQPTQAWLWAQLGRRQPRLPYSHRSNTRMRVVAYLDAATGAVHSQEMARVSAVRLAANVGQLSGQYPQAERIYLVWDNWPIHLHPKVAEALCPALRGAGGLVAPHLRPLAEPDGEGVAVDSTTGDPCPSMV